VSVHEPTTGEYGAPRTVARFVLFALLGLLLEVFFTAAHELASGNWNMHGRTSPWMMLDYGLLGVAVMPLGRAMARRGVPLAGRAFVYMLGIFGIEYVSGLAFNAFGLVIWDYSDKAYNLHGQITLLYAPFWFALGLVVESLYARVDAMAVVLVRGLGARELTPSNTAEENG